MGQARPAYEKAAAEKDTAPLVERPFVTALRKVELPEAQKGAVSVPIGVEDGSGVARKSWPVRCGVPFAQGLLPKDARFELLSPDGKTTSLQTAPMATWISVPKASFRFTAGAPQYYESSKGVRRGFCGTCGSPLTYENVKLPGACGSA